ncbi:MAG TPA: phosphonopyruvate decarboxylase [Ignavibacteria bacterium]|nr:phosphonopyruvate decarboxylase [Ignavibacteria bacterium]HQY51143.1 phosphonopyruvate decarboxylase [Ignavibacteria bacterium]HRA98995.1 phosphonopyruvate decarboxylase [Ignavibacteria bacterium]
MKPADFFKLLSENKIHFYTGVPDSLLKNFCSFVNDNVSPENHIISTNEGSAVALAAGHYLSTGNPGLVYMQNSGFGNAINPLLSLSDTEVYGIPVMLMIGWRGEPGKKDEPQHIKQGRVMIELLKSLEIPFRIFSSENNEVKKDIKELYEISISNNCPAAMLISEGFFESYKSENNVENNYPVSREEAIKLIAGLTNEDDIIISTTGKTSRELYEFRDEKIFGHQNDFLTVGSMGHSSQIALGISLNKKNNNVFILDGDGAVLMHMGSLALIGSEAPENLKHIILNNGAHESVGGQPTAGFKISFTEIAKACGYKTTLLAETREQIKNDFNVLKNSFGPSLLEIRINKNSRSDLGRPSSSPMENRNDFMKFLNQL